MSRFFGFFVKISQMVPFYSKTRVCMSMATEDGRTTVDAYSLGVGNGIENRLFVSFYGRLSPSPCSLCEWSCQFAYVLCCRFSALDQVVFRG